MHEWNCHLEIFYPSSSNRTLILGNICLSEQIFYRKQSLDAPEIRKQIFRILRFNTKRERCREHISLNIINGRLLFCFTGFRSLWAFAINISQFGQRNKIASSSSITILRVDLCGNYMKEHVLHSKPVNPPWSKLKNSATIVNTVFLVLLLRYCLIKYQVESYRVFSPCLLIEQLLLIFDYCMLFATQEQV